MMGFLNKIKLNTVYNIVYLITGVVVVLKSPIYFPDSYTFLEMALNHSPGYCSFVKIFTSIFGNYFEFPLVVSQYIIIVYGIHYFTETLKKVFNLSQIGIIIIQLLCLAPCLYVHNLGSTILTEALTYPFFLVVFSLTLKMLIETNLKYLYKICGILWLLILIRGQFIALIPVLILIVGYIILKTKSFSQNYIYILLIIVVPLVTNLSEKVYNKVVFGHYINNTMNYVHLVTSQFYIANEEDIKLFDNEDEIAYFDLIYSSLKEAKLTRNQNAELKIGDYKFYENNFPKICNRRIYELGLNYFENKGLNYIDRSLALNNLCSKMVFPLFKQNFKVWLKLFVKNVINSFGSSKQLLFFILLLLYGVFNLVKYNNNISKFIVLATLFMFANNTFIALVVHSIKRYVFYFDWVIFVTFIILINQIYKNQKLSES